MCVKRRIDLAALQATQWVLAQIRLTDLAKGNTF